MKFCFTLFFTILILLESCNYKRRNNETIVNIENTSKNNSFDAIDSLCFVFKNGKPEDTTRTNNLKKLYGIYIDNKTSLANQNRIETVFIGQSYYYTNSSVSAFDYWIYSQKAPIVLSTTDSSLITKTCRLLTILSRKSKTIDPRYSSIVDKCVIQNVKYGNQNKELGLLQSKPITILLLERNESKFGSRELNNCYVQSIRNISDSLCCTFVYKYQYSLGYYQGVISQK
jgi:hypothetical protein